MSFVPPPQKAPPGTANGASVTNNAADAAGVAEVTAGVEDAFITSRTFDLYWVDKSALMYKDGIVKVRCGLNALINNLGAGDDSMMNAHECIFVADATERYG